MAQPLPRLRRNLDFMPSPVEGRPGLLIRDNYGYSGATLIIPPVLAACLETFDGASTELQLREALVRLTGEIEVGPVARHLVDTLSRAGFLENEVYEELRDQRHRSFAEATERSASHAGAAYPAEGPELTKTLAGYMNGCSPAAAGGMLGIAAPHVSPFGGAESYRAAYGALGQDAGDRTFVILGTSHYGEMDRFGLTRKTFKTPFGAARTNLELAEELAAEPAVLMEDYCHAIEHSIEFQIVFLQHLFGANVSVLPLLCGSFARSIYGGGLPEDNENVKRFLGKLGEMGAREGKRLVWVLGVDMAHMGRRYGDLWDARADSGQMIETSERDRQRIERINAGDAHGFWELVQENRDDLKWCGSSPFYTFLRVMPDARGELLHYQQWNIDETSVVSFAGMRFY